MTAPQMCPRCREEQLKDPVEIQNQMCWNCQCEAAMGRPVPACVVERHNIRSRHYEAVA